MMRKTAINMAEELFVEKLYEALVRDVPPKGAGGIIKSDKEIEQFIEGLRIE